MKIFNVPLCGKRTEIGNAHQCVASVLSDLMIDYENELKGQKKPLVTYSLQFELSRVWGAKAFGIRQMADTMEVLNCLLVSVHNAYIGKCDSTEPIDDDECGCLVHEKIFMKFENQIRCESCGFTSENFLNSLTHSFYTEKFTGDIHALEASQKNEFAYTFLHLDQFPRYAKEQIISTNAGTCENCFDSLTSKKKLLNSPQFLIFQIIWKDSKFQKLSNFELVASLKFSLNIRELFETDQNENYNFIGFIINAPYHYYYIARSNNEWWEVNDSKVERLKDIYSILSRLTRLQIKIVGIVFEKNDHKFDEIISGSELKYSERSIILLMSCFNCYSIIEDKKCLNCGWSREKSIQKWNCPKCLKKNNGIQCFKCQFKRFSFEEHCKICKELIFYCICRGRNYCKNCSNKLNTDKYCGNCGSKFKSRLYNDYCYSCATEVKPNNAICFNCSELFWKCLNCKIRVTSPVKCPSCGLKKSEDLWFCHSCNIFNKKRKDCEKCLKPEGQKEYCNVCCSEAFPICKCEKKIECVLCSNYLVSRNDLICFRCGDQVIDNYCSSCQEFIPKLFFPCRKCFNDRNQELNQRLGHSKADDCLVCRLKINDEIFLCWVCGEAFYTELGCNCNPDKSVCLPCLEELEYCTKCKKFFLGTKCKRCDLLKLDLLINELPYSQMFDSDWECLKCNTFNRQGVVFCEFCNHPQLSSFSESFKCKFCGIISPYPLCKECLWVHRCSGCYKRIYFTQRYSCGECGGSLENSYCSTCKILVPRNRVLCITCTENMSSCDCGRKRHPRSLLCKYCRLKITFKTIICSYCKTQKKLDTCYYCANELVEEICGKCNLENSKKNFYRCGTCSLIRHKQKNEVREPDLLDLDID